MNARKQLASLQDKLDQLSPRERKLLTYGGGLCALAFTWLVLIEPALLTIQRAPANQEALVSKAGQVMRAAQELDTLKSARSRVVVPEDNLQDRIGQLLAENGIAETAALQRTEEGDLRVEFSQTSASAVLAWMAQIDGISSVDVHQVEIEKTEAGLLSGYLVLLPNQTARAGNAP